MNDTVDPETAGTLQTTLCTICAKIATFLCSPAAWESNEYEPVTATFRSISRNHKCGTCQQLSQAIATKYPGRSHIWNEDLDLLVGSRRRAGRQTISFIFDNTPVISLPAQRFPADQHRWLEHSPSIKTAPLIRAALRCDVDHAGDCHSIQDPWAKVDHIPEIVVIDVEKECLSIQPGTCRYLALSYVWGVGNLNITQTTLSNFKQFLCPGSFHADSNECQLPATARDSMVVARQFGVTYLWVDRFCIVQDDPVHKETQIQGMAAIYANSYFTIAACEGANGNAGLLGSGPHRPRKDPFYRLEFGPACRFIGPSEMSINLSAPYFDRGWTYQEWMLSRRVLVFHDETATWKCRGMLENEAGVEVIDYPSADTLERSFLPHEDNAYLFSPWPEVHAYAMAVKSYSERLLTFEGDFLLAFSSVMSVMGRSMRGGILYGVPEMCFDGALLWDTNSFWEPLTRRRDPTGSIIKRLPSWSFAGWNCRVSTKSWRMVYHYDLRSEDGVCTKNNGREQYEPNEWVHLTSIVNFYKVNEAIHMREKIPNTFYIEDEDTREGREVRFENLPESFKFHGHESPLPAPRNDIYSPIIEFRTARLFAQISAAKDEVKHFIKDNAGNPIGRMRIPDHTTSIPRAEFIRLSLARSPHKRFWQYMPEAEQVHQSCPKDKWGKCFWRECVVPKEWTYSFYFVLWVERDEGIVYRKALGWISKSYWDSAETDEVDVRLG